MRPRTLVAAVVAAALSVGGIGLYWKGRTEGAARARDKVEAAQAQARVSGLEVHGARAIAASAAEATA